MSGEWQAVGLSEDPTPGDPEAVRALATRLGLQATTAEGGTTRLRAIAGGGGGELAMRGDYAASYAEALRELPGQLAKLATAYRGAGGALSAYATTLADAKTKSAAALRNGLDAQGRYRGALAQVAALLPPDRAMLLWPDDELSPASIAQATANLPTPELAGQVQVIARHGQDARYDQTLAARLASEAKTMRDGAVTTCAQGIDDALKGSGIKNRPWWQKAWNFAKTPFTSWNHFVSFCGEVALVTGVIAAFVLTGGTAALVLGAIAFAASAVVFTDSVVKWREGRGSFGMVALNAAALIPGGKALGPAFKDAGLAVRTASRDSRLITAGLRAGGAVSRVGRNVGSAVPFGLRSGGAVRGPLMEKGLQFARSTGCRFLGRDPVDMASGQMVLTQTDVELPGVLSWVLQRTYQSGYTCGRWFGPGWSSSLDLRLEVDERGVCYAAPDGVLLAFPHPEPGGPAVLPEQGPRVELVLDESGRYSVLDAAAGQVLRFATPAFGQRGVALPLAAIVDRNGNSVELGYDVAGDLVSVSHSGGYRLDVEVRNHLITAVRTVAAGDEPAVEVVRYGYDRAGMLTHVINSSSAALRFDYDADGQITRWLDRNGTGACHLGHNLSYDGFLARVAGARHAA
jgi:YD repeat-containing protein